MTELTISINIKWQCISYYIFDNNIYVLLLLNITKSTRSLFTASYFRKIIIFIKNISALISKMSSNFLPLTRERVWLQGNDNVWSNSLRNEGFPCVKFLLSNAYFSNELKKSHELIDIFDCFCFKREKSVYNLWKFYD